MKQDSTATESQTPKPDPKAVAAARAGFSAWLRAEREARGVALEDIARVTKIQLRTLELLEEGRFEHLPADVFVRGFIRNYTRVVGLDGALALARYDECGVNPGPAARARVEGMIDSMAPLAPMAARKVQSTPPPSEMLPAVSLPPQPQFLASGSLQMPVVVEPAPEPVVEPAPEPVVEAVADAIPEPFVEAAPEPAPEASAPVKGKRARKRGKGRAKKTTAPIAVETAAEPIAEPEPIVEAAPEPEPEVVVTIEAEEPTAPVTVTAPPAVAPVSWAAALFKPRAPTVAAPTLVIDDDDPESAERERELRAQPDPTKRSFLPPSLLDGDRGGRQGGLTLAVIILLIVATLTLSYLMRRPSSSGEGVTMRAGDDVTLIA